MSDIKKTEKGEYINTETGKVIAADIDGEIIWDCHHKTKSKYYDDVMKLHDPSYVKEEVVVEEKKPSTPMPELSPKWGDRTPGYPEWILENKGQEAYDKLFVRNGVDHYLKHRDEILRFE